LKIGGRHEHVRRATVDPGNQQRLVDLLIRATDGFVSRASGLISSTLHRSVDGTKVAMYAQWRSVEDYQAMRHDPGPLPFLEEALHTQPTPLPALTMGPHRGGVTISSSVKKNCEFFLPYASTKVAAYRRAF
jgi:hypothetical protein